MTVLPFTPRAQPGESPLSLLRRAAHGNGMRSTLRFFYSFNPRVDHSATAFGTLSRNPQLFRHTGLAAGIPADDIDAVMYRRAGAGGRDELIWNGLRVPVGAVSFRQAKTCVACLLDQGYSSSEWDHCAAVACARHEVLLQDACPICLESWTHDLGPMACGCAPADLRAAAVPVPTAAASLLHRLIAAKDQVGLSLLGTLERVLDWWSRLGLSLHPLAKALALENLITARWPELPPTASRHARDRLHPRVALAPLLNSALPAAQSLSLSLLSAEMPPLNVRPLTQKMRASEAMAVLGVRRVPFSKLVRDGHLVTTSESFAVADINRLLRSTEGSPCSSSTLVPVDGLRAGSGPLSLSTIVSQIKAGQITAYHCPAALGLDGLQVHAASTAEDPDRPPAFGIAEVALRLGVHTECVRSLIRTGLLSAQRAPASTGTKWVFCPDVVDRFDNTYVIASALAKDHDAPVTTFASRIRSAGVMPVSGPDVDGGLTYVFLRLEISRLDLLRVATQDYVSPAGRKRGATKAIDRTCSWTETARVLGLSSPQLHSAMSNGWFEGFVREGKERRFLISDVHALRDRLQRDYSTVAAAAATLSQTPAQFRRAWVDTGLVKLHRFGLQDLVKFADLEQPRAIWSELATGSEIGRLTGRDRTLCSNLEKTGQLRPARVIGSGTRKIKLYSRTAEALCRFLPTNPEIAHST